MPGHHALFTTLRNEGNLLSADFLQRIAIYDPNLAGLTSTDYHRHDVQLNEAVTYSWNRLLKTWSNFKSALSNDTDDRVAMAITQERWLQEVFRELYYGHLPRAQPVEVDGRRYGISHHWNHTPIHLVSFKEKLDEKRMQGRGLHYSPYNLVQQYINYTDRHPWGIVSNGLRLRLLRKNMHMIRQTYLEFDLEAMMQGEIYADFVLFWLLCHESRLEGERPEECWLEQWSDLTQKEGIRALSQHGTNVERAVTALGSGFLSCRTNQSLHEKLRTGALSSLDYYRQLLRFVYRLIVLFVAEDREVLFHPTSTEQARKRYSDYYSTTRLRHLADRSPRTPHIDLFRGLRLIMEQLGQPCGCLELGLSPLNGFLFSKKAIPDLEACDIANSDLLDAVQELAFAFDGKTRQRVNYKYIGSEELGSVYEGLLELHPTLNIEAKTFELRKAKGNERKTTGSYYTPSDLVSSLLDSALEPVIREAKSKPDAEQALLDLKVCDPACGSGHFLVAAAHRIADQLTIVRAKDDEPTVEERRKALRDVVSRCIYGVDINPMAVELCKVSLWMEAIEPGKPLSFLEHHILCGNSLIGATPRLLQRGIPDSAFEPIEGDDKKLCNEYKKLNKKFREGNRTLFDPEGQPWETISKLTYNMTKLEDMSDETVESYHTKEEFRQQIIESNDYVSERLVADAWCAAFVWKKINAFQYPITDEIFWKIAKNPDDIKPWMKDEIIRLRNQYNFFHWHLEFRGIFREVANGEKLKNEQAGWCDGFDVVLGNPPWEHTELKEQEWFANRNPEIANTVGAERKDKIEMLTVNDPDMYFQFLNACRQEEGVSHFARASQRYPLCGRGRINMYSIFAETNRLILNQRGRVGCIVQSGIATDDTNKYFFQDLIKSQSLVSLYDFDNTERLFRHVDSRYKFCLLTLTGAHQPMTENPRFVFFAHSTDDLDAKGRSFTLSLNDIALINPNTGTCPIFRSSQDANLIKSIYARMPILFNEHPSEDNPWKITFRQGHFNMTSDSKLFRTREQLESGGWTLKGNVFFKDYERCLPLYEGKTISYYDHRFGGYSGYSQSISNLSEAEHNNPWQLSLPHYWIHESHTHNLGFDDLKALLGFRDITNSTNERTAIFSILPVVPCGHTLPIILFDSKHAYGLAYFTSCASAFIFDFIARQKLGNTHMTFFTLKQQPVLPPDIYNQICQWDERVSLGNWILPRVLELAYAAWDLEPFAKDCGYDGPPFHWDEERRFILRCELDAAYFHLYGIKRDDVDYIMETFPLVKKKDKKRYGNYRTKQTILLIYDAMDRAIKMGKLYRTLLTPSPADPSLSHSPNR